MDYGLVNDPQSEISDRDLESLITSIRRDMPKVIQLTPNSAATAVHLNPSDERYSNCSLLKSN